MQMIMYIETIRETTKSITRSEINGKDSQTENREQVKTEKSTKTANHKQSHQDELT